MSFVLSQADQIANVKDHIESVVHNLVLRVILRVSVFGTRKNRQLVQSDDNVVNQPDYVELWSNFDRLGRRLVPGELNSSEDVESEVEDG
jgi:hypothetical protein